MAEDTEDTEDAEEGKEGQEGKEGEDLKDRERVESDVFFSLVYTSKKQNAKDVTAWWNARLAYATGKGNLAVSPAVSIEPRGALDSDYDAERLLKSELSGAIPGTVFFVPFTASIPVATGAEERAYFAAKRALDRRATVVEKGLAALKEGKGKLAGCKACGSKIARTHIGGIDCPVCRNCLLPAGAHARYTDLLGEVEDATAVITRGLGERKLKKGTYLMVAARLPRSLFPAELPCGARDDGSLEI